MRLKGPSGVKPGGGHPANGSYPGEIPGFRSNRKPIVSQVYSLVVYGVIISLYS